MSHSVFSGLSGGPRVQPRKNCVSSSPLSIVDVHDGTRLVAIVVRSEMGVRGVNVNGVFRREKESVVSSVVPRDRTRGLWTACRLESCGPGHCFCVSHSVGWRIFVALPSLSTILSLYTPDHYSQLAARKIDADAVVAAMYCGKALAA